MFLFVNGPFCADISGSEACKTRKDAEVADEKHVPRKPAEGSLMAHGQDTAGRRKLE